VGWEGKNDVAINVPEKPLDPVDIVVVLKIKGLSRAHAQP
jgi:hypothetical protein